MYCKVCKIDPCKYGDEFAKSQGTTGPGPLKGAVVSNDKDPDGLKQPGRESALEARVKALEEEVGIIFDLLPDEDGELPDGFYAEAQPNGGVHLNEVAIKFAVAAFWEALGVDPKTTGKSFTAYPGVYNLFGIDITGERL